MVDLDADGSRDAVYYDPAEFLALDQKAIDAHVKERVDSWAAVVAAKSAELPVEPTKAELQAVKADLEAQLAGVDALIQQKP